MEYERTRHNDIGSGAAQKRHGMGTDAAIGDQTDTCAPVAQQRRRVRETVAGIRRQILPFDA